MKQGGAEQERSRPEAARLDAAVGEASSLRGIESLTVLAPFRPDAAPEWAVSTRPDAYWGIPLPTDAADMAYGQKLRNQLRRARRDILIAREGWKPDHAELVEQYIRSRPFAPGTRHLFRNIGPYVEAVPDALLFAARDCEARCRASPWAITRRSEPFLPVRLPRPGKPARHGGRPFGRPRRRRHPARAYAPEPWPRHQSGHRVLQTQVERDDPPAPRGNVMGGATAPGSRPARVLKKLFGM